MKNIVPGQSHFHHVCSEILSQPLSPPTSWNPAALASSPGTQVPMSPVSSESWRHLPSMLPWLPQPPPPGFGSAEFDSHPVFFPTKNLRGCKAPESEMVAGARWTPRPHTHTHISMSGGPYAHCPQCHLTTPPSSLASVSEV